VVSDVVNAAANQPHTLRSKQLELQSEYGQTGQMTTTRRATLSAKRLQCGALCSHAETPTVDLKLKIS